MRKVVDWSLVVIAVVLSVNFLIDRVSPPLLLSWYENAYKTLALECNHARIAARRAALKPIDDSDIQLQLAKSISIELLKCHEKDLLRNRLLAWGVPLAALRAIELETLSEDSSIPAHALTIEYAK